MGGLLEHLERVSPASRYSRVNTEAETLSLAASRLFQTPEKAEGQIHSGRWIMGAPKFWSEWSEFRGLPGLLALWGKKASYKAPPALRCGKPVAVAEGSDGRQPVLRHRSEMASCAISANGLMEYSLTAGTAKRQHARKLQQNPPCFNFA
jgi:hypothetical protein